MPKIGSNIKALRSEKGITLLEARTVGDLTYRDGSDWQIWVQLEPQKYSSPENAQAIAEFLARAYRGQTGYDDLVIVTVWTLGKDPAIYAKGKAY